jgi:hypothetical protein
MFIMLLETTAIAEISFPPVVWSLIRMTLECQEVPAVYKTRDDEAGAEGVPLAAGGRAGY